jgi:hypothetical protein
MTVLEFLGLHPVVGCFLAALCAMVICRAMEGP